MPVPQKRTKSLTEMLSPDILTQRRRMFLGWIEDCEHIQELFVEGLLANVPNGRTDGDG